MTNRNNITHPNVAIALAAYNGMKWLPEQIQSILEQKNVTITIFISIDPSTDGTDNYCNQLSLENQKIKILPNIGKFGGAAKNFFRLIRDIPNDFFDYIAFSDQDDIWHKEKISRAISKMQLNNHDGYSSNLTAFNQKDYKSWMVKKGGTPKTLDYLFQGASAGCTYVITQKAMQLVKDKIGHDHSSFPDGFSHDWLIYAICRSHNFSWFFDEDSYIQYRQHMNNVYGALPGITGYINKFNRTKSGWYRHHILWLENFIQNRDEEKTVLNAIRSLKINNRLWLALNSFKFRRYKKDCIFLSIIFLIGAI